MKEEPLMMDNSSAAPGNAPEVSDVPPVLDEPGAPGVSGDAGSAPVNPIAGNPADLVPGVSTAAQSSYAQNDVALHPAQPVKKKKTGLIIGLVLAGLLLIAGGAFAAWFFCFYNTSEKIAYDAVRQLISADNVATSGTLSYIISSDDDGTLTTMEINLDSSSSHLPNSTNVGLKFVQTQDGEVVDNHQVELNLGTAMMTDGVAYFRIGGLSKLLDQYFEANDIDSDNEFVSTIYDVAGKVDNQWWQIDIDDLLKSDLLGLDDTDGISGFYHCLVDKASADHSSELINLYSDHRFFSLTTPQVYTTPAAGHTAYEVNIDYGELTEFLNALTYSSLSDDVEVCFDTYASEVDDEIGLKLSMTREKLTESQVKKLFPDDWSLRIEVGNLNHKLYMTELDIRGDDSDIDMFSAVARFDYSPVEVSAPEEYRPITDLVNIVIDAASDLSTVDLGGDVFDLIDFSGDEEEDDDDDGEYKIYLDDNCWQGENGTKNCISALEQDEDDDYDDDDDDYEDDGDDEF